ncbi:MAG: PfkB family carbohydrate kinase [Candidatus Omnitrophota bacterium]
MMKKLISLVTALSFLFSSVGLGTDAFAMSGSGGGINLAPALVLDDLGDDSPHYKNIALARIALQMDLVELDKLTEIDRATDIGVIRKAFERFEAVHEIPEKTILQPAKIRTFFNQVEPVGGHIFRVPVSVNKGGKTYNYQLVFSTVRNAGDPFPVEFLTDEQLDGLRGAIVLRDSLPVRVGTNTAAISNYMQHERYDIVIDFAHKSRLALPVAESARGYVKEISAIAGLIIKGSASVEGRPLYIIPMTGDVRDMLDNNKVTVVARNGEEKKVIAHSHASNGAVHIFLEEREVAALMSGERSPAAEFKRRETVNKIKRLLAHEIGVMLGCPVLRFDGESPVNEIDDRYREGLRIQEALRAGGEPHTLNMREYAVADLDANLKTRDYAGIFGHGKRAEPVVNMGGVNVPVRVIRELNIRQDGIRAIFQTVSGYTVLVPTSRIISVLDPQGNIVIKAKDAQNGYFVSPNGRYLLLIDLESRATVFDIMAGRPLIENVNAWSGAVFTGDSKFVRTKGSDSFERIYGLEDRGETGIVSPDGAYAAITNSGTSRTMVIDLKDGRAILKDIDASNGAIFSNDSKYLRVAGQNRAPVMYDLRTGEAVKPAVEPKPAAAARGQKQSKGPEGASGPIAQAAPAARSIAQIAVECGIDPKDAARVRVLEAISKGEVSSMDIGVRQLEQVGVAPDKAKTVYAELFRMRLLAKPEAAAAAAVADIPQDMREKLEKIAREQGINTADPRRIGVLMRILLFNGEMAPDVLESAANALYRICDVNRNMAPEVVKQIRMLRPAVVQPQGPGVTAMTGVGEAKSETPETAKIYRAGQQKPGGSPVDMLMMFGEDPDRFFVAVGFTDFDQLQIGHIAGFEVSERTRQRDRKALIEADYIKMIRPGHYRITKEGIRAVLYLIKHNTNGMASYRLTEGAALGFPGFPEYLKENPLSDFKLAVPLKSAVYSFDDESIRTARRDEYETSRKIATEHGTSYVTEGGIPRTGRGSSDGTGRVGRPTEPGKSPEDAKKVFALSQGLQTLLNNVGFVTTQQYREGHDEVRAAHPGLGFGRPSETTARDDLNKLVRAGFLRMPNRGKYAVTIAGWKEIEEITAAESGRDTAVREMAILRSENGRERVENLLRQVALKAAADAGISYDPQEASLPLGDLLRDIAGRAGAIVSDVEEESLRALKVLDDKGAYDREFAYSIKRGEIAYVRKSALTGLLGMAPAVLNGIERGEGEASLIARIRGVIATVAPASREMANIIGVPAEKTAPAKDPQEVIEMMKEFAREPLSAPLPAVMRTYPPDAPVITVVGSIVADIIVPLGKDSQYPLPSDPRLAWKGDKVFVTPPSEATDGYLNGLTSELRGRLKVTYGGPGFASAMVLNELGARVKLIGAVGDDELGHGLIKLMRDKGMDTTGIRVVKDVSTSTNLIFSNQDTGETAYNLSLGSANEYLTEADIPDEALRCSVLHFGGIALNKQLMPRIGSLIDRAKRMGAKVGWDTVVDLYGLEGSPKAREAMSKLDYLTPSIKEARKISGKEETGDIIQFFGETLGIPAVFLKLGEGGSEVAISGKGVSGAAQRFHMPAVRGVKIADTTGAGDSYSAYMAYGFAKGMTPKEAAKGATVCGALTCERIGGGSIGEEPLRAFNKKMLVFEAQLEDLENYGFGSDISVKSFYNHIKAKDYAACALALREGVAEMGDVQRAERIFKERHLPYILTNSPPLYREELRASLLKKKDMMPFALAIASDEQARLEALLYSRDADKRVRALKQLNGMIRRGEIICAPETEENNVHVHSKFSFSPYYPEAIAYWAKRGGLRNVGIIDHDTTDGIPSFLAAAGLLGQQVTSGFEMRVSMPERFAKHVINAPGIANMAYFLCHALPDGRHPAILEMLEKVRASKERRNRAMIEKVNKRMGAAGLDVMVPYEEDVSALAENGNCTDRHLMMGLAIVINDRYGRGEARKNAYEAVLGRKLSAGEEENIDNEESDMEILRGGLLKPGSPVSCFIAPDPEECPSMEYVVDSIIAAGGVPVYPYLGDSKRNGTDEENILRELFPYLKSIGVLGIAIMPHRNTDEEIKGVVALAEEFGLKVFSGVDINKDTMPFIEERARVAQYPQFRQGGDFLVGHEFMERRFGFGYYNENAIRTIPDDRERFGFFASVGALGFETLNRFKDKPAGAVSSRSGRILYREILDVHSQLPEGAAEARSYLTRQMTVSPEDMERVQSGMMDQMDSGLAARPSSLKMLPAFVGVPTGRETGEYLGVDVGGTNLRVLRVRLEGNGRFSIVGDIGKFKFEERHMHGTAEELFDFIAGSIGSFMAAQGMPLDREIKLGLTWSFPVEQTGAASGIHKEWTKGWTTSGVVGNDVVKLLEAGLDRKAPGSVKVAALCNDTVGTLATARYQDPDCDMGIILGTGTNAAFWLPIGQIAKWVDDGLSRQNMMINMEWGNFDSVPRTPWDFVLDLESNNSGRQLLEKMVSGMYLGEIARIIMARLISNNLLFGGVSSPIFNTVPAEMGKDGFLTEHMSAIESDDSKDLEGVGSLLAEFGVNNSTVEDRRLVKSVCELVSTKAARVTAAAIVAVIRKMDPAISRKHVAAVDGSLYKNYPYFKERIRAALRELLDSGAGENVSDNIEIVMTEDGSGVGAAIIAAAAADMVPQKAAAAGGSPRQLEALRPMEGINIKVAALDWDGTISRIREGWEGIMTPIVAAIIEGKELTEEEFNDLIDSVKDIDDIRFDSDIMTPAMRRLVDQGKISREAMIWARGMIEETKGEPTPTQFGRACDEAIKRGKGAIFQWAFDYCRAKEAAEGRPMVESEPGRYFCKMYLEKLFAVRNYRLGLVDSGAVQPGAFLVPGGVEFVRMLAARGVVINIITGSDKKGVQEEVNLLGLGDWVTVTGYDVDKAIASKYDVTKNIKETGNLADNEFLVVGDGKVEIKAGVELGSVVIVIRSRDNASNFQRLLDLRPNYVMGASFEPVEELVAFLVPQMSPDEQPRDANGQFGKKPFRDARGALTVIALSMTLKGTSLSIDKRDFTLAAFRSEYNEVKSRFPRLGMPGLPEDMKNDSQTRRDLDALAAEGHLVKRPIGAVDGYSVTEKGMDAIADILVSYSARDSSAIEGLLRIWRFDKVAGILRHIVEHYTELRLDEQKIEMARLREMVRVINFSTNKDVFLISRAFTELPEFVRRYLSGTHGLGPAEAAAAAAKKANPGVEGTSNPEPAKGIGQFVRSDEFPANFTEVERETWELLENGRFAMIAISMSDAVESLSGLTDEKQSEEKEKLRGMCRTINSSNKRNGFLTSAAFRNLPERVVVSLRGDYGLVTVIAGANSVMPLSETASALLGKAQDAVPAWYSQNGWTPEEFGMALRKNECTMGQDIRVDDRSMLVFSERATFGRRVEGKEEYEPGLGIALPRLTQSGVRVAVIAATAAQAALIDRLNSGRPENQKIVYGSSVSDIMAKVTGIARYYYFRVADEKSMPDVNVAGIFDITVENIIRALGQVCNITRPEELETLRRAFIKFAVAA